MPTASENTEDADSTDVADDGPPRGALIAAVVVAVAAVIGVLVATALAQRPSALQPVPLVTIRRPRLPGRHVRRC